MLRDFMLAFVALFVAVDTLRVTPLYLSLTGSLSVEERKRVDQIALLPPEAAHLVGEELEKLGQAREAVRARLEATERFDRAASAFLVALGPGPRLFVPTADPAKRAKLLGKATERILKDLDDASPETLRARLKALVRQVTVQGDGNVVVEGTYEPLAIEALQGADRAAGGDSDAVRRMWVPGERTPDCAKHRVRHRQAMKVIGIG